MVQSILRHLLTGAFLSLLILLTTAQQITFPVALTANVTSALSSEWNTNVTSLCSQAAVTVGTANNPSGLIVCYNVAALESFTGFFSGDLRLYAVSQSTLPTGSKVQMNFDFGKAGTVQILNDNSSSTQSVSQATPRRKRDISLLEKGHVHKRQNNIVTNPLSTVQPGSYAAVAHPQSGIKSITATPITLVSSTQTLIPPAILPGERSLLSAQRLPIEAPKVQVPLANPTSSSSSSPPVAVLGLSSKQPSVTSTTGSVQTPIARRSAAGQELEVLQFVGRLDVDLTNSKPNELGVAGSLLPKISLLVTTPDATNQTIDMSSSTRAFLIGVKGSLVTVNTFVLPGRILLGADGSTDKVGLFIVTIWTAIFLVIMSAGIITRYQMRVQYRTKTRMARRNIII